MSLPSPNSAGDNLEVSAGAIYGYRVIRHFDINDAPMRSPYTLRKRLTKLRRGNWTEPLSGFTTGGPIDILSC